MSFYNKNRVDFIWETKSMFHSSRNYLLFSTFLIILPFPKWLTHSEVLGTSGWGVGEVVPFAFWGQFWPFLAYRTDPVANRAKGKAMQCHSFKSNNQFLKARTEIKHLSCTNQHRYTVLHILFMIFHNVKLILFIHCCLWYYLTSLGCVGQKWTGTTKMYC